MKDRETVLEIGMVLLSVGLAAAAGVLLFGRAAGGARHRRRRAEAAPEVGTISSQRHQHISSVAAR